MSRHRQPPSRTKRTPCTRRLASKDPPVLLVGTVEDSLVVIPEAIAIDLARTWDAITSSSTWGEFRSRVSEARYQEVLKACDGMDWDTETPIRDSDPFSISSVPGCEDGDYPEWPAQLMLKWLPPSVVYAPFARIESSALNGLFLELDPTALPEIVQILNSAGYSCVRDDRTVHLACGYSVPSDSSNEGVRQDER